jgi:hypothetical protein
MPIITDKPLEKILLRLYEEDLIVLRQLYGGTNRVNETIRNIVHKHLTEATAKTKETNK